MSKAPAAILDHIVILVPQKTLLDLPSWLTSTFTILTGGRHADGVTENKLVLLQDGVYLELIAFVPGKDEERKTHRWGHRREGHIIDWANTLSSEVDLEVIRSRVDGAGSGIRYSEPVDGGRIKPDGTELKWVISAPYADEPGSSKLADFVGGEAPFWCLDHTPRERRVPYKVGQDATHPSGALGVARVAVLVRDEVTFHALKATYDALQGKEGTSEAGSTWSWPLSVPDEALESTGKGAARSLTLTLVDGGSSRAEVNVTVRLSLFSGLKTGRVGGPLGEGGPSFEVEFVKP